MKDVVKKVIEHGSGVIEFKATRYKTIRTYLKRRAIETNFEFCYIESTNFNSAEVVLGGKRYVMGFREAALGYMRLEFDEKKNA